MFFGISCRWKCALQNSANEWHVYTPLFPFTQPLRVFLIGFIQPVYVLWCYHGLFKRFHGFLWSTELIFCSLTVLPIDCHRAVLCSAMMLCYFTRGVNGCSCAVDRLIIRDQRSRARLIDHHGLWCDWRRTQRHTHHQTAHAWQRGGQHHRKGEFQTVVHSNKIFLLCYCTSEDLYLLLYYIPKCNIVTFTSHKNITVHCICRRHI